MQLNFNHIANGFYISDDNKYSLILPQAVSVRFSSSRDNNNYYDFGSQPFCRFEGGTLDIVNTIDYRGITGPYQYILDHINDYISPDHNYIYYEFLSSDSTSVRFKLVSNPPNVLYDDYHFYAPHYGILYKLDDFVTNLYPELLNNYEQAAMAQSFLNDIDSQKELDPDYWTDKFLAFCKFVEEYNKNVLLLRSTRKVDASVSGSISQSGQQQQIDLSSLNANTARIADNLQILDDNQNVKSITKVLDDKNNDQQVVVTTIEKAPYNPLLEDDEF